MKNTVNVDSIKINIKRMNIMEGCIRLNQFNLGKPLNLQNNQLLNK